MRMERRGCEGREGGGLSAVVNTLHLGPVGDLAGLVDAELEVHLELLVVDRPLERGQRKTDEPQPVRGRKFFGRKVEGKIRTLQALPVLVPPISLQVPSSLARWSQPKTA